MSNSNKSHNKDKNSKKVTFSCKGNDKVRIYADVVNINIDCCK